MEPSRIAFGLWNSASTAPGRGQPGPHESLVRTALESGFRTFITSDAIEGGAADRGLGAALAATGLRGECFLTGCIGAPSPGHGGDYGSAGGSAGSQSDEQIQKFVREAAIGLLERSQIGHLDLLLFESPGRWAFRSAALWAAMSELKAEGLTRGIGIAPGPSNGYALDLLHFLDQFGEGIDSAMIVYNPLEPWPGELVLASAKARAVTLLGRESAPPPGPSAPRANEERGARMARVFELAGRHGLDGWQLLTAWTTSREPVISYAPRLLPSASQSVEEVIRAAGCAHSQSAAVESAFGELRQLGENKGRVALKGGTQQFQGKPQAEQWPLDPELVETAARHQLVLDRDYFCANDPRDLRDFGMPIRGIPQAIDRRLYMQLQVVTNVTNRQQAVQDLQGAGTAAVLYADLNDPRAVGLLLWDEDPLQLSAKAEAVHALPAFAQGRIRPEFTMLARTYGFGREDDLPYWLTRRPIEAATYPNRPWAVWYPLRRKPGFYRLPKDEQAEMLREHGVIGHNFGSAGYATDIRLECFGMDPADNEFVLGLLSERLDWLSRLVKEMRATRQTGEFMDHLGPFFVGHTLYQHSGAHA